MADGALRGEQHLYGAVRINLSALHTHLGHARPATSKSDFGHWLPSITDRRRSVFRLPGGVLSPRADRILPRDAVHSTVLVIVNLSVRPSVCHSCWLCQHGSAIQSWFFSPYGSPWFYFSGAKFHLHIPTEWPANVRLNTSEVCKNVVFNIKTACILETVSNMAKVTIDHYTNSYTSFRLVPRSMTLTDIWRSF